MDNHGRIPEMVRIRREMMRSQIQHACTARASDELGRSFAHLRTLTMHPIEEALLDALNHACKTPGEGPALRRLYDAWGCSFPPPDHGDAIFGPLDEAIKAAEAEVAQQESEGSESPSEVALKLRQDVIDKCNRVKALIPPAKPRELLRHSAEELFTLYVQAGMPIARLALHGKAQDMMHYLASQLYLGRETDLEPLLRELDDSFDLASKPLQELVIGMMMESFDRLAMAASEHLEASRVKPASLRDGKEPATT